MNDLEDGKDVWDKLAGQLSDVIMAIAGKIPQSSQEEIPQPADRAEIIISKAARDAAFISGSMALPPGPLGFVTILPDIYFIWRRQSQMVADLAALYGKSTKLDPETMIYCLFKHAAAQAVRGLAVRAGERTIIQRASLRALEQTAQEVGVKVTSKLTRKAVSRSIPILGALGVAAYAYYDTSRIGATAVGLFEA